MEGEEVGAEGAEVGFVGRVVGRVEVVEEGEVLQVLRCGEEVWGG